MKNIWLKKNECTGCGACANICPKQAIQMQIDGSGFLYPEIKRNCIDCDTCEKICSARGAYSKKHTDEPKTYAVWSKNEDVRYLSTSGGAFTELARTIISQAGYAVGAQYGVDNMVEHIMVSDEEGLSHIRQSKYVQSYAGDIYKDVRELLAKGEFVVFCGAPCQVAALYAFLGAGNDDRLFTIDFICRGMNSPKAYRSWLNEIEEQENSKVSRVWFKYKEGGWNSSPKRTRIDFEDGHFIVKDAEKNLFMHEYLKSNLYIRPSCGNCDFKGVPRQADITLADFWGIEKKIDDDKGTSLVLINSDKGKDLFDQTKESFICLERNFSEIFVGNVCFNESVKIPKKSEAFLNDLNNGTFSEILNIYSKVPFWKKIVRKIKSLLI